MAPYCRRCLTEGITQEYNDGIPKRTSIINEKKAVINANPILQGAAEIGLKSKEDTIFEYLGHLEKPIYRIFRNLAGDKSLGCLPSGLMKGESTLVGLEFVFSFWVSEISVGVQVIKQCQISHNTSYPKDALGMCFKQAACFRQNGVENGR